MAEKRMFAKSIVTSAEFLSLKVSTRELYFQLGMQADDDGFINNTEIIMRMIGAKKADYNTLIQNGYLINIRKGLDVIRDWNINNTLRSDRYKTSIYTTEKSRLKKVSGRYVLMDEGIQVGIPEEIPEVSVKEVMLSNNNKKECEDKVSKPIPEDKAHSRKPYGEYGHILLSDLEIDDLIKNHGEYKVRTAIYCLDSYCEESGKGYKNYKAKIESLGFQMVVDRKYTLPRRYRSEEYSLETKPNEPTDREWLEMWKNDSDISSTGNSESKTDTNHTEGFKEQEECEIHESYTDSFGNVFHYNKELEEYETESDSEELPFS